MWEGKNIFMAAYSAIIQVSEGIPSISSFKNFIQQSSTLGPPPPSPPSILTDVYQNLRTFALLLK